MAEQDLKSSQEDEEFSSAKARKMSVDMEHQEDGEGEIGEDGEEYGGEGPARGQSSRARTEESPVTSKDSDGKEGGEGRRHRTSSDRRRHHHRHHSSSHREHRRRRSGGHSDADGEMQGAEEGNRGRRRSDSAGDSYSDHGGADKGSHGHSRKHERSSRRSSQPHSQSQQQLRSRQNVEDSADNGEWSDSYEDPLPHRDSINPSKRHGKEKRDSYQTHIGALPHKGEAEDGEILEDGELDDDEEEMEGVREEETHRNEAEASDSPSKSYGKEDKHDRKKDHKERRKRDSDEKRKRKKYTDTENSEEESPPVPAPAWGSGYQGHKPKTSPFRNKAPRYGRGSKGYQSPPGLYDSPSYSEDSEEEGLAKGPLAEGYIDASVAADEKEGLFNSKTSLGKKKKRERIYEKVDRKRGRFMDGKIEGPPKKKPLVDLAMSERPVCKFYMEGKCAKGSGCQFNHDVEKPKKMEVCKYHLTVKGCHKERCPYMHHFPCKYYHTGAKCYSGDRCKFSHDPLTEDTRRALEMRVAAEHIVDMEDPEYNYEYRSNREFEPRTRPSLLGSPPRMRPEMKKIPSLFEIEVRPPGQSPKPSPQAVRPSGFYNETNASPKPGMGPPTSTGGPVNSPNMGMMNSGGPMNQQNNQQGFNNSQGNMGGGGGGPGLLQPPVRPSGIMGAGPMGNRPNMMGNQQGMNPQQQRPGGGPPIQFMGPAQMNNQQQPQQQQGGNLPPVLNMLGAIIREAAMHKSPSSGPNNSMNMGPGNMGPRPNMGPNMNNMGPNNIRPGNMGPNNMQGGVGMGAMGPNNMGGPPNTGGNMAPNNMGNMGPNNMGNMPPNSVNNMGPANMGQNMMGSNNNMNMGPNSGMSNMGPNNMNMNKMGPNTSMGNMGPQNLNSMGPNASMGPGHDMNKSGMNPNMGPNNTMMGNTRNAGMGQPNMGQEVGIMDVDYRIKPDYEEMEEASQDLTELDKLRRQLKEQIDKEDEEAGDEEHEDGTVEMRDDEKMQMRDQASPDRSEDKDDSRDSRVGNKAEVEAELDSIEIPAHLPKKQRELFKRIQQQQILREKERERQEALKAAEEAKADADDWYSSDEEDGDGPAKPKLTDVLKKLNQETLASAATKENQPSLASIASGAVSTSTSASIAMPSTASTFNIMQMINAIKNQTTTSSATSSSKAAAASPPQTSTMVSPSTDSPASPPPPSPNKIPTFTLPVLTVDPPVISAKPLKPLVYNIVKISLPSARPYMQLPNDVNASDPVFKLDPRVKWHLQYLEKQMQKEQLRRNSAEGDKSPKAADPRLKKTPADPRLAKGGESPGSGKGDGSKPTDPRLQRVQAQSRPVDPRLARQATANMDPRINRQNSQNSQDGSSFMGGSMNSMGGNSMMANQMGGLVGNQMGGHMNNNQMGGPMGTNQMGGPMNAMGGPVNSMGPMGNQMGGPMGSQMGGPMGNQMGGPMGNQMRGPVMGQMGGNMGNQMGGPMGNQMGGAMNPMGGRPMGPMGNNMNMMGGGPMNQMGGPMGNMGPRPNQMNRMGGPQGMGNGGGPGPNMMGGGIGSRGPMNQPNSLGGDPGVFDSPVNSNPIDPRLGGPRPPNDPRSAADPRFRNKAADPREQKLNPKDPRSSAARDPRAVPVSSPNEDFSGDPRNYSGKSDSRLQGNFGQSPNSFGQNETSSFSNQGNFKMSQKQEEWMQDTDLRLEQEGFSPSTLSSSSSSAVLAVQEGDPASKPPPKFDHRNDPRFKRVKRFTGQRKSSMDYSSPLGGEEGQGASDDGGDSGYNNYNRPKVTSRDPRARNNAPSPTLPDTLQDFDTPEMTLTPPPVSEPELKVKDLFKTIDPTASPFC